MIVFHLVLDAGHYAKVTIVPKTIRMEQTTKKENRESFFTDNAEKLRSAIGSNRIKSMPQLKSSVVQVANRRQKPRKLAKTNVVLRKIWIAKLIMAPLKWY